MLHRFYTNNLFHSGVKLVSLGSGHLYLSPPGRGGFGGPRNFLDLFGGLRNFLDPFGGLRDFSNGFGGLRNFLDWFRGLRNFLDQLGVWKENS